MPRQVKLLLLQISRFGIVVMGLFGGFLKNIAPPEDIARFWSGFASAIAGIALMLVLLVGRSKPNSRKTEYWLRRALVFILTSFVFFFAYFWFYNIDTVEYGQTRKIAGTVYTAKAQQHIAKYPTISREQVLLDFAGHSEEVWTPDSLRMARGELGALYSVSVGCFVLGLVFGAEGLVKRNEQA